MHIVISLSCCGVAIGVGGFTLPGMPALPAGFIPGGTIIRMLSDN